MESIMLRRLSLRSHLASAFAIAALSALPLITSCSNKATEEQMKTLHGLDSQRDQLRGDLSSAQNSLKDAQGKLASADRDLADCQADTKAAQAGLEKWPNVWPDSTEWNPPPPPPAPEKATKGKKHQGTARKNTQ
jgi:hypothetical protein